MAQAYNSASCLPAGSRRLLTPRPSSRSVRETMRSRPGSQNAAMWLWPWCGVAEKGAATNLRDSKYQPIL